MSVQRVVLASLLAVVILACAAPAYAAGPATSPETAGPYTFTTAGSARPFETTSNALPGDPKSPAWWGWVKSRYRGSTPGSLWCAGTPTRTLSATSLYPMGTRGTATLDATQTADWYSSSFNFYYSWPDYSPYKVSPYDADSFCVAWKVTGAPATQVDWSLPRQAALNSWALKTENLSSAGNKSVVSRQPSRLFFDFTDNVGTYGELPATNLGPAVDDVTLTGYTFGPVRYLAAEICTTADTYDVKLTWSAPASSTIDPSPDTRPKTYRVWREEIAAPGAYTELPSVEETSTVTTILDTSAVGSKDYRYFVQAWDATGKAHWGELAPGIKVIPERLTPVLTATLPNSPRVVDYYGSTPIRASLTDDAGPLSGHVVRLYTSTSSASGPWSISSVPSSETTTGVYYLVPRTTTKTWYQLRSVTTTEYASAVTASSLLIQSRAKLYTPSVPSLAYRTRAITISALMLPKHTGTSYFKFYRRLYNSKTRKYYYSTTPSFTKTAKVTYSGSYAKIYLSLKMPYTGVWAVRAYHYDTSHAATLGPLSRAITVR